MRFKVILILFLAIIIGGPILFPGDGVNTNGFLTLIALMVICLSVIGVVLMIMQRKSGMSWKENRNAARNILDDAMHDLRPWYGGEEQLDLLDMDEQELNEFLERNSIIYKEYYGDEYD